MQYLSSCHCIYAALQMFFHQLQFAFENLMYMKYSPPVTDLSIALMYNGLVKRVSYGRGGSVVS